MGENPVIKDEAELDKLLKYSDLLNGSLYSDLVSMSRMAATIRQLWKERDAARYAKKLRKLAANHEGPKP